MAVIIRHWEPDNRPNMFDFGPPLRAKEVFNRIGQHRGSGDSGCHSMDAEAPLSECLLLFLSSDYRIREYEGNSSSSDGRKENGSCREFEIAQQVATVNGLLLDAHQGVALSSYI